MPSTATRLAPLLVLLGGACHPEPVPQPAKEAALTLVELRSLRAGVEARATACDSGAVCREVRQGEPLERGTFSASAGTQAVLELPGGTRLTVSPDSSLSALGGDTLQLDRGTVALDAPRGAAARPVLRSLGQLVTPADEQALKVVLSSDGEVATVTVHRGVALVGPPGAAARLGRGQTAQLRGEEVLPVYAGAELSQEAEPAVDRPVARGLGRMTARVPGRTEVTGGVELASHEVRVEVRGGVATTTVEEVFASSADQVLEGRFVFPVPSAASVSRLALWVGDELMEGEMVERTRAASIFQGIVDDTVRPRDPALLEWSQGSELSLKIFPIPARGSRRVLLSFEEPITELGGRGRYVYPLAAGEDRATKLGQLSISVRVEGQDVFDVMTPHHAAAITSERSGTSVSFHASETVPDRDFVVTWRRPRADAAAALVEQSGGAFLVRAPVELPAGAAAPAMATVSRVLVLDASRSQSPATFAAQAELASALVGALDEADRFAVLACDSACTSYPADGLASASGPMRAALVAWLARVEPGGSSDLAGAIEAGVAALPDVEGAQLVYLGDGSPTAGELSVAGIARRLARAVRPGLDVRLLGVGRAVDAVVLRGVADAIGATFDPIDLADAGSRRRSEELVLALSQPVVRDVEVELPSGASLAAPPPTAMRLGAELHVAGRGGIPAGSTVRVTGTIGAQRYDRSLPIAVGASPAGLAARAFARARIDELTRRDGEGDQREIVELSSKFFVLSRHTSLLVLENDAMYRAFGVPRTKVGAGGERIASPSAPPRVRMGGVQPPPPAAEWGRLLDAGSSLGAKGGRDAIGNMWGDEVGGAFGTGGLGLSGIGEGGGGRGEGIGLGDIGTIGRGSGAGTGTGFGPAAGGSSERARPPLVRQGATSVSGRLPVEVIRRVVRQSFGRVRLCYEKGLLKNPELAGRVVVSFVIGSDGTVRSASGGSSTIADAAVVACIVGAFQRVTFPAPESGSVTVTYPFVLSPGEGGVSSSGASDPGRSRPRVAEPAVAHQQGDDGWMATGEADLEKLRAKLLEDATQRRSHAALVRGLLARGRFEEARARARQFADVDPDSALALDLLAQASLAAGDPSAALRALDGLAELTPRSTAVHRRIARGLEAGGEERRACAHWRALADLAPTDDEGAAQALRCRARVLGEAAGVRAELASALPAAPGPAASASPLRELATALDRGGAPAFTPAPAWSAVAAVAACSGGCPEVVTVAPNGTVVAPLVPDVRGEPWARSDAGPVRTLLVGGDPDARVSVTVSAQGVSRTVALTRRERSTVLLTSARL